MKNSLALLVLAAMLITAPALSAAEIRVAVASNFKAAMTSLVTRFEAATDHSVTLIAGSTGKQFAQIINGAPFDAFFAADGRRPQILEQRGLAVAGSRFTYARGKLVLWSAQPGYVDNLGNVLLNGKFRHLAIANPKLAPYGLAAQQVLRALAVDFANGSTVVQGENISQALQFVKSGNAELGLVAKSQVVRPGQPLVGSYWEIPEDLYSPIDQQAVVLSDGIAVRSFIAFINGQDALRIIQSYGYDVPH